MESVKNNYFNYFYLKNNFNSPIHYFNFKINYYYKTFTIFIKSPNKNNLKTYYDNETYSLLKSNKLPLL
jgi:hypothetical protein